MAWGWSTRPSKSRSQRHGGGDLAVAPAVAAHDEACNARDDARRNLNSATNAVDTFFTTVSQEDLLEEPGMQPLREKLLKLALPYCQEFAARGSDDPARQVALAKASLNWGMITGEIGMKYESKRVLEIAIRHLERLVQANPKVIEYRDIQAETYLYLGLIHIEQGMMEKAKAELLKVIALERDLLAKNPTMDNSRLSLTEAQRTSHGFRQIPASSTSLRRPVRRYCGSQGKSYHAAIASTSSSSSSHRQNLRPEPGSAVRPGHHSLHAPSGMGEEEDG